MTMFLTVTFLIYMAMEKAIERETFMEKTLLFIKSMDCPAEEQMIRMKLADIAAVRRLTFDLDNRQLSILHTGELSDIKAAIDSLDYGAEVISTETGLDLDETAGNDRIDRKLLWTVLIINFSVFTIEIIAGLLADSMGLIADSLDELADAFIYALSIYAIAGTMMVKRRIARSSGILQLGLALWGFIEIIRRFISDEPTPNVIVMIVLSCIALAGNSASLYLLRQSKTQEVHIKATQVFTSNDVIVNIGVIFAALLVAVFQSKVPDLLIGAAVFIIVVRGALRIFKIK